MRRSVVFGLGVVALVLGRYRGRIIPAVRDDDDADVDAAGGGAKARALPFRLVLHRTRPEQHARAVVVLVRIRLIVGRCWGLCDWRAIFVIVVGMKVESNGSIGGMFRGLD